MPAAGGAAPQITRHGGFEGFESPDGKWFYYTKDRGIAGLWRVGTEGGEETPVAELADAGYWRSWSVTQNGICYVGRAGSPPYQIRFYSFSDGLTKTLATMEKAPLWNYSGLAASADGKIILYAQYDQNANSIMLADLVK
jgi:Tol biopolymer transport system component